MSKVQTSYPLAALGGLLLGLAYWRVTGVVSVSGLMFLASGAVIVRLIGLSRPDVPNPPKSLRLLLGSTLVVAAYWIFQSTPDVGAIGLWIYYVISALYFSYCMS